MRAVLLLILAVGHVTASVDVLEGRVVGVADGDTLTLLDGNRQQHKIRLAGVDAPEKAQPYGQRSKQHLSEHAFRKDAKAECYKIDRYNRDVCTVFVNGKDIGLAQLDAGLAWWFRKYAHARATAEGSHRLRGSRGQGSGRSGRSMAGQEPGAAVGVAS